MSTMPYSHWDDSRSGVYEWRPDDGTVRVEGMSFGVGSGGFDERTEDEPYRMRDAEPASPSPASDATLTD